MNEFIHVYCGKDEVYWSSHADTYRCDSCQESIWNEGDLISKRDILEIDNRIVIKSCQEAA